jgi:drug/metabolite transporter (DMT)-like permease
VSPLLALLAAVVYGVADFCGGIATRRAPVLAVATSSQAVGLLALLLVAPLFSTHLPGGGVLLWSAGAGVAGGVGVALLYYGLAIGRVSVVAPITAVCSIAIPVLVGIGLGERPKVAALVGIGLAIVAVAFISQGHAEPGIVPATGVRRRRPAVDRSVPVALASGVAIGFFLVCLARTGTGSGLWPLVAARMVSIAMLAGAALIARQGLKVPSEARPATLGSGVLDVLANALYLGAVREGPLGLVATLASLYPASTVLLARLVLHERLRPVQSVGLACAALAIALITSS